MDKIPKNNVKLRAWDCPLKKASGGEVFKDSLKSEDCILILKRCMENIEKKMEVLCIATKTQKKVRLKVNCNW